MGMPPRSSAARREGSADGAGDKRNFGPRNSDGTWMGNVERGPSKPFPFGIGAVVGELTCLRWERKYDKSGRSCFHPVMRCSCGWEGVVHRSNVQRGATTRCDRCAKRKAIETRWAQKGYFAVCPDRVHRDRLLDRISAIIVRCTNPDSTVYPDYGGRGITVYGPWLKDRVKFLKYLVSLKGWDKPELQLDRIDNDRGYTPDNLRFVTRGENMANKRKIKARDVERLKLELQRLEAENADLRHRLRRAKKQIHNSDK